MHQLDIITEKHWVFEEILAKSALLSPARNITELHAQPPSKSWHDLHPFPWNKTLGPPPASNASGRFTFFKIH
jgi:hypothetical protein